MSAACEEGIEHSSTLCSGMGSGKQVVAPPKSRGPDCIFHEIIINFQRKIDKSDLYLSIAYVKAEAEIYRLRQVMLGSEKVTRLATSPLALNQMRKLINSLQT